MIEVIKLAIRNLIEQITPLVFIVRVRGEVKALFFLLGYTAGSTVLLFTKTLIFDLI